ncbi:hypothetical protein G8C92_04815 [Paenibacillus donghaensis]|uniref:hypothetical protein n=1 Tax=Paenibacillus donghaensis TaxID=414771 RepID=UPI0018838309|nr:hypothetical protein [Paenibacillus donghaensis]MBE9913365.1 hypothetical protein [Paenibacillus donghaensis]
MLKDFQIRVVANACITRVNDGEGTIDQVLTTYPMQLVDREKVLKYAHVLRPDRAPSDQNKA